MDISPVDYHSAVRMGELIEVTSVEKLVAWPTPQDYNEAVQVPEHCFADAELRGGTPAVNEFGLPRPISGGFASVYRLHTPGRDVAVRCFLNRVKDRQHRYQEITRFLHSVHAPWAVPCEFHENGMLVHADWYPIVKMEWVKGETLGAWVERHLDQPERLLEMRQRVLHVVSHLQTLGSAHGDLQPANIIVLSDDSVRLVDYDGMFVPSLAGSGSTELGHKNFQHPRRSGEHFDERLDDFSAWLLGSALAILAIDPSLWSELNCADESFLFRHSDLNDPDHALAFSVLEDHEDDRIIAITRMIRWFCRNEPDAIPPIDPALTLIEFPVDELPLVDYVPPPAVALPDAEALERTFAERRKYVPKRVPRRRSSLLTSRMAVDLSTSLHQELNRGKKAIWISMASIAVLLFVGTIGFRYHMHDEAFWAVRSWLNPRPAAMLEDAIMAKERGDLSYAERTLDAVIASANDKGNGLTKADMVQALFHRAQISLGLGHARDAKEMFERARVLETKNGGTQVFDDEEYNVQELLCDAQLGQSKQAAEKLERIFSQDPGFAYENETQYYVVTENLLLEDTKAGLKFWESWLSALMRENEDGRAYEMELRLSKQLYAYAARLAESPNPQPYQLRVAAEICDFLIKSRRAELTKDLEQGVNNLAATLHDFGHASH